MKVNMFEFSDDSIRQRKYLPILAVLSMMLMSCSGVLGNKLIATSFGAISAASLVSPFWFIVGDIITEVYGFKTSIKIYLSVILSQLIFAIICYLLIKIDSPVGWHGQDGFELVLGNLVRVAIFQFVGMSIAWPLNAKLLSRWKFLVKGKYFGLRCIASSGLAMLLFTIISVPLSLIGKIPPENIVTIVLVSCGLKIFFTILLSFPCSLLVGWIKIREKLYITSFHN